MSRSPRKKPARTRLSVLVQTHVTPEVGRRMAERVQATGDTESSYLRRLIHADLGLLTPSKDTPT